MQMRRYAIGIVSKAGRYGGTYANPGKKGNIRDDANLNQLLVLANMESYNAILIGQGKTMSERIVLLRELAVRQMETLSMVSMDGIKQLPGGDSEKE